MKRHIAFGWLILVALAAGAIWALLASLPWDRWSASQDLPAWVQAVGSLFALLLAIAVPAVQHMLSERRIQDEAKAYVNRQFRFAIMLSEEAVAFCDSLLQAIDQQRNFGGKKFPEDQLADWREKYRTLDYSVLSSEAANVLAETKRLLAQLETIYRGSSELVLLGLTNDPVHNAKQAIERRLEKLRRMKT